MQTLSCFTLSALWEDLPRTEYETIVERCAFV